MWLIKKNSMKARAHIWMGDDTCCTMFSTGGIKRKTKYMVVQDRMGIPVCLMCQNNSRKWRVASAYRRIKA